MSGFASGSASHRGRSAVPRTYGDLGESASTTQVCQLAASNDTNNLQPHLSATPRALESQRMNTSCLKFLRPD